MTDHASEGLPRKDHELQELEREKLREEINQLRASAKTKWVTPTVLGVLLPLVAGFGVWILGELKQYNEGYRAIAQRDALEKEKTELRQQKDSLNLELATLLQLKAHYAAESDRLRRDTEAKQATIDTTYLRGCFTQAEALYALDHIKGMGPPPDERAMMEVRQQIKQLPETTAAAMNDILGRYELSLTVINISRDVIGEFDDALKLMPASEWTKKLHGMPSGAVLRGRKIMFSNDGDDNAYYDVTEGRFLTEEEVAAAR